MPSQNDCFTFLLSEMCFFRQEYTSYFNCVEIITAQLTSYLNMKPFNCNFVKNRSTVQLPSLDSQPYLTPDLQLCFYYFTVKPKTNMEL